MSSLVRRMQIRMMQRAGYTREKFVGIVDPITGERKIQEVRRGGEITDPDDNPIGRSWPKQIPSRARAPSNAKAKDLVARKNRHSIFAAPPRSLRRSKRSQARLVARAEARKAAGQ